MVKLGADTVPTVPAAPPSAGPDRALDPPPPAAPLPGTGRPDAAEETAAAAEDDVAAAEDDVAAAEDDVAAAEGDAAVGDEDEAQPAASPSTAATTIHRLLLFETNRRVALDMGRAGWISCGVVGSNSFMVSSFVFRITYTVRAARGQYL